MYYLSAGAYMPGIHYLIGITDHYSGTIVQVIVINMNTTAQIAIGGTKRGNHFIVLHICPQIGVEVRRGIFIVGRIVIIVL